MTNPQPRERLAGTPVPLLTYTLTPTPDPLQVKGQDGQLTITVTNDTDEVVSCGLIAFTLPVGSGADALTGNPDSVQLTAPKNWRLRQPEPGKGRFEAAPTRPKAKQISPGAESALVFTLTHIAVDDVVGTCAIGVEEDTASPPAATSLSVTKVLPGLTFTDFRPVAVAVPRGTPATLEWKATAPTEGQASYTLEYGTVAPFSVDDALSWVSPALYEDTEFILTLHAAQGSTPVEHRLTTTVTVTEPDLHAHDLRVTGTAQWINPPQVVLSGPVATRRTCTAETDGIISGWIYTEADQSPATLIVRVEPTQGAPKYTTSVQSSTDPGVDKRTWKYIFVPVPKGSKVDITTECYTPEQMNTLVTWHPLGKGRLNSVR
ncbi:MULTISPECIES: hypothetical protein [Streptomycetaceae]|uniref:hypothetical protein n=1 Tax=Streptomycetaceae TaxID=2062 RepID=UPI00093AF16E|nr:hypothetical protein [Streptomyces sp. CB02056]OKI05635.1 hypothetical protein AMK13_20060 [Streptomyces sp. CB02056]